MYFVPSPNFLPRLSSKTFWTCGKFVMNMQNECAYAKKQKQKENKRKKCMSMTISQLWGFLYMHCLEKKKLFPIGRHSKRHR